MQGKVKSEQSTRIKVYVGIDVCKERLDVFISPVGQLFDVSNDKTGIRRLLKRLAAFEVVLIGMEATGKFHRSVHRALHAAGIAVAVVNPQRPRLFALIKGTPAKTDAVDARLLAAYAETMAPTAIQPNPQAVEEIQELTRGRQQMVAARTALMNQLGGTTTAILSRELKRQIKLIEASIKTIEEAIRSLIGSDPGLSRRHQILRSIPSVGEVAATVMLVGISELGTLTAKQIAMLVGVAPIARDSGNSSGQRHIHGGRQQVRSGLYMPALNACFNNPDLKHFYTRLIANGKKQKVAITAVIRKLVILANTLIREDRTWQPKNT